MVPVAAALLHRYGIGAVSLLIGLEAAGLPLPGEAVMIGAALYAARTHQLSIAGITAAASAGAILGCLTGYGIGRFAGAVLLDRYSGHFGLNHDRRALARYLLRRSGFLLIFLGRFIVVLRSTAGLLAGAGTMEFSSFMVANVAGGVLWPLLYCLGAYSLGRSMLHVAGHAAWALGAASLLALGLAFRFVRRHERQLTASALAEE